MANKLNAHDQMLADMAEKMGVTVEEFTRTVYGAVAGSEDAEIVQQGQIQATDVGRSWQTPVGSWRPESHGSDNPESLRCTRQYVNLVLQNRRDAEATVFTANTTTETCLLAQWYLMG